MHRIEAEFCTIIVESYKVDENKEDTENIVTNISNSLADDNTERTNVEMELDKVEIDKISAKALDGKGLSQDSHQLVNEQASR